MTYTAGHPKRRCSS